MNELRALEDDLPRSSSKHVINATASERCGVSTPEVNSNRNNNTTSDYDRNNNNTNNNKCHNRNRNNNDNKMNAGPHQRYDPTEPEADRSRNSAADELRIRRAALIRRQESRANISYLRQLSPELECAIPHQYRPANWSSADLVPIFPRHNISNYTVAQPLTDAEIRENQDIVKRNNDDKKQGEPNAKKSKQ